jgi:nucleotide-binding universal stress UspA family protein
MRYIVAVDDSDESDDTVEYAVDHASAFGATLELVHVVVPETEFLGEELVLQGRKEATEKGHRILEDAHDHADAVADSDVDLDTVLLTGRPADAIVDRASETDADAVFVGHRGLSTEQEEVVGSVAKSIVSKATVPVTVVR